ncbi:hypothetical protein K8Z61_15290 [Nocardioides sp. TRM66260-LWL]|uniref:Gmad2 immunoglobulin-like domain-containing protein n=1 Tax=Nocardioides sp. TRM66260-LWL TaxID=2874478 RepID=UPI001CC7F50A|nr:Gmad2 immunoglobulin-like domain-containing protein [Nocardioides sp. TRM66260-LWL]MBZ5735857.1 hypothetical protein [Nocardioides sp. TRM66260-LWL]
MTRLTSRLASAVLPFALLVPLAACGGESPSPVADAGSPSATPDPTGASSTGGSPTPSAGGSPSSSPTVATDGETASGIGTSDTAVPLYWAGSRGATFQDRLYREFRRTQGDPLTGAANLLTNGAPGRFTYRSLLPRRPVDSVVVRDGRIVMTVADPRWRSPGRLTPAQARLAVQQLVYTLQGVAQQRLPLELRIDGSDGPQPLLGLSTTDGIAAAPSGTTLSPVMITTPDEGARLDLRRIRITGTADAPEGTVRWRIADGGGETIKEGFVTTAGFGRQYPWSVDVDLSKNTVSPGDEVTVYAFLDDYSDEVKFPTDGRGITLR